MTKETLSKTWMRLHQFFELWTPTTASNMKSVIMNESLKMWCFFSYGAMHNALNCSIQRLKEILFWKTRTNVGTHKHTYTLTLERLSRRVFRLIKSPQTSHYQCKWVWPSVYPTKNRYTTPLPPNDSAKLKEAPTKDIPTNFLNLMLHGADTIFFFLTADMVCVCVLR